MKISFRNQCLHYQLIGNGPRWVIAFHGYGESGSAFHSLATEMSMDCTFICPDLPLHGKSIWELATPFTPSELEEIIRLLMQEHGFNSLVLAGYSMGGRLVSSLLTKSKLPIEEVWLFAPDGFHRNPWYWLATQTAWGNRLFKFTMQQPNWLLKAMKIAKTLNLLHPGIYKFSIQFLMQEKARKDLYERWTFYKNFKVNQEELNDQLIANRMHLRLFSENSIGSFLLPMAGGYRNIMPHLPLPSCYKRGTVCLIRPLHLILPQQSGCLFTKLAPDATT